MSMPQAWLFSKNHSINVVARGEFKYFTATANCFSAFLASNKLKPQVAKFV